MTDTTGTTAGASGSSQPVSNVGSDANMLDPSTPATTPGVAAGSSSQGRYPVAIGNGVVLANNGEMICPKPMPLPGVVIFVHGVNSDGEWYKAAEEGLCKGLNTRLGRLDDQMVHKGPDAGQMCPVTYIDGLTPDGYINPQMWSGTYIQPDASYSPVIHFRWGYKANQDELKLYGDKIFLNEKNYWGGGPFANGCSSLPDLWHEGLNDRLFLWITVQHLNSVKSRQVYGCPPRAYGVLAALRLAKLIESIRKKQADVPITVVCHSQGNMVGIAAAFLGDRMPPVQDQQQPQPQTGRCVADTYVLCNPPYSLVPSNTTDNWSQRGIRDKNGHVGREDYVARAETLKAYFGILRERAELEPDAGLLNEAMGNTQVSAKSGKSYEAGKDRTDYGLNGHTFGRVTLYCNPHDQVISATTVQGIGWRGISEDEKKDLNCQGVFTQRVFASGWKVGVIGRYRYWDDDWRKNTNDTKGFWFPPSPVARFALGRALESNENLLPKVFTLVTSPLLYLFNLTHVAVNAKPDRKWAVQIDAPPLQPGFLPQAKKFGRDIEPSKDGDVTSTFNEGYDPGAAARDAKKGSDGVPVDPNDPYNSYKPSPSSSDAEQAQGDIDSEASMRYEDHASLRMSARRADRSGWVDDQGNVVGEDDASKASDAYSDWRKQKITAMLSDGMENNATNHSTIMTNADHAEMALAYDIAIGASRLVPGDLSKLRIEADWRFGDGLTKEDSSYPYAKYFNTGKMGSQPLNEWIKTDTEASMPKKIIDSRDGGFFLKLGSHT